MTAASTPPTTAIEAGASLPSDLPATWFGTYTDADLAYAVELDTASGEIVRTLVSYVTGECVEYDGADECTFFPGIAPVSVDVSATQIAVGICCEPGAGWTRVFDRSTGDEIASTFGSEPALAGFGNILATAVYVDGGTYILTDTNSAATAPLPLAADWGDSSDWDGGRLAVEIGNGVAIWFWDGALDASGDVTPTVSPSDPSRAWAHPTFAASGNLVVAEHTTDDASPSLGTVLDTSGAFTLATDGLIVATFPYGGRVIQQTYDAAGKYLIYALSDGSIRWRGGGSSGTLKAAGTNFTAAAWH